MISSHESSRDSSPRLARDKNFTGNGNARWKIDRMTILLDDSPAFPLDYRTGHGDRERRSWPMDGREKAAFSPRLVANFSREEGKKGRARTFCLRSQNYSTIRRESVARIDVEGERGKKRS